MIPLPVFGIFFTSGFTGLVYEVLWMRELGLLFGNTVHAAATTLAAFFLGLAAGSYVWGQRAARLPRPLRSYAMLEAGVAVSALLYFLLRDAYYVLYTPLLQLFGAQHGLFLAVKFVLSMGILLAPACLMGGTLPVLSQYLVQHREALGRTTSMLYAVNTCGGALGAFMAGFYLPPLLGYTRSYLLAIGLTVGVAIIAWWLDRRSVAPASLAVSMAETGIPATPLSSRTIRGLAFCSGFVTLGLQVLWTRMFAQVLQNSVYTYALILVTFLISLALGAGLAHAMMRQRLRFVPMFCGLMLGAALLVGLSPFMFNWLTDGLGYLGGRENWGAHMVRVFGAAGLVIGMPSILLGSILPFLLKLHEPYMVHAGRTVGDVVAVNTIGAIAGSLWAGFIGLEWFGLWSSIRLMAVVYIVVVLLLTTQSPTASWLSPIAPVCCLFLFLSFWDTSRLPRVRVQPLKRQESLYQVWEGSAATVAVVKTGRDLKLKVNNFYTVGGTGTVKFEERQSHLPLMIHTQPRSVFFLGLGSGITAGAALMHQVERVVVAELIPEVIEAAQAYFAPYVHGLFNDARATIVTADGRHYLRGTSERFDVIVSDLFLPWRAGVGSLYTREHFTTTLGRLNDNGLFAQWLPLYQMSRDAFATITHTMLDVFPQVTLWRGDFLATRPIVLLLGHRVPEPFEPHILPRTDSVPLIAHYAGNLTAAKPVFRNAPLNTDNNPVIEYLAPMTHRQHRANQVSWFVGDALITFMESLLEIMPPEQDPYLQHLRDRDLRMVRAGFHLHRAGVLQKKGDTIAAQEELARYKRALARY